MVQWLKCEISLPVESMSECIGRSSTYLKELGDAVVLFTDHCVISLLKKEEAGGSRPTYLLLPVDWPTVH